MIPIDCKITNFLMLTHVKNSFSWLLFKNNLGSSQQYCIKIVYLTVILESMTTLFARVSLHLFDGIAQIAAFRAFYSCLRITAWCLI